MADGPFHYLVFVKKLQDMGKLMQRSGAGLLVQCPAHDDRTPSMSLGYKPDGDQRILVNCKVGCTAEQICKAMGLPTSALFAGRLDGTKGMQKQTPRGAVKQRTELGKNIAPEIAPIPKRDLEFQVEYQYTDPDGHLVSVVKRYIDRATGKKTFNQFKADGTPGIKDVKRWLYRIADWRGKQTVSVAEGEKCVEALWAIGIPATTNLGGSSGWLDEYADQIVEQGVQRAIVFVDNDEPGRKWARAVVKSLMKRPQITQVKVVELSGLGDGEDVFDWIARGGTRDKLAEFVRPIAPEVADAEEEEEEVTAANLWMRPSELEDKDITYIINKMVPSGMLGAISGRAGRGKSFLGIEIAKSILTNTNLFGVSDFEYMPDSEGRTKVYLALFDDPERLVRARLASMGILDHPELTVTTERKMMRFIEQEQAKGNENAHLDFVRMLADSIIDSRPRYVLIDALYLFVPGGGQSDKGNSAGAMMPIMQEFNRVANVTGATVALVVHNNKADADLFGSQVIGNMMKWVLGLTLPKKFEKDKSGARTTPDRILQLSKIKSGAASEWGLRIVGTADPNRIEWDVVSIEELEAKDGKKKKEQAIAEFVDWVQFFLAKGAKTQQDVREAAYEAGFKKWRLVSTPEVREQAGIVVSHPKPSDPWYWTLREEVPSERSGSSVQADSEGQGHQESLDGV